MPQAEALQGEPLDTDLLRNQEKLKQEFSLCSDIIYRECCMEGTLKAIIVYIDGMSDVQGLDEAVLRPLMNHFRQQADAEEAGEKAGHENLWLPTMQVNKAHSRDEVVKAILRGETAILLEGESYALVADLVSLEKRSVEEPTSEKVVRGPRDGFLESLRTNVSLIRRRLRTPLLKVESLQAGEMTRTNIALVYIEGVAKETLVDEIRTRLGRIVVDGILDSGNVEELIEDNVISPFPQIQNTERPDVAASSLMEGKVVVIVDNSPFVLVLPMTYWSALQAADDYTGHYLYATFVRWVRYTFVHVSLLLPSLYVALTTFHPQVIPTPLVISIASAREGIPFPAVIEAFLMEFIFEGLREAGIRLPQQVGPAVSIAGALVIGQSVVAAGIVSTPLIIIVSLTGIASFAFPLYNAGTAFRMLRFPLLIVAGMLGFYGIVLFLIALSVHLVMLKPFGVPYMAPYAPMVPENLNDVLIRAPKWSMRKRMRWLAGRNLERFPKRKRP
ncbi:spore germination protein [Paenibacillus puerhi]|uniref:spore germination protein n=1 Tax=Paenibacillus puerhi TaxID=2692622 RepID=UPI0013581716|nr:spore germination protein [Paenibacillus puerhi]